MVYTVGAGWFWFYMVVGLILSLVGLIWMILNLNESKSPAGGLVCLLLSAPIFHFAVFAGYHFRVNVNYRALLINQIQGKVVGVRQPGVQGRPLVGVWVQSWPAAKAQQLRLNLQPGTASASSEDSISLWIDTKVFLDLSGIDPKGAYEAVNGDWKRFSNEYLEEQLMREVRETSRLFTVEEHTTLRERWVSTLEERSQAVLATAGYGIRIVPGRTTMSWDFVNATDAEAYDASHRASFLATQRKYEKDALGIEAEMADIRANMLVTTTTGAIASWQKVAEFVQGQPSAVQDFLVNYMRLQGDLEYLRLVGQLKPSVVFPPGGNSLTTTYDTSKFSIPTPSVTPTATPQKK